MALHYIRDIWWRLSQYEENRKYTQAWTNFWLKLMVLFCFRSESKFYGDSELRLLRIATCSEPRSFLPSVNFTAFILNVSCFSILCPQEKSGYCLVQSQASYLVNFFMWISSHGVFFPTNLYFLIKIHFKLSDSC